MYVILTYDVGVKRVAKVMKTCRKFLMHEQKSVFEGSLTNAELSRLKSALVKLIEPDSDRVSIYEFKSLKYSSKERIGLIADSNNVL